MHESERLDRATGPGPDPRVTDADLVRSCRYFRRSLWMVTCRARIVSPAAGSDTLSPFSVTPWRWVGLSLCSSKGLEGTSSCAVTAPPTHHLFSRTISQRRNHNINPGPGVLTDSLDPLPFALASAGSSRSSLSQSEEVTAEENVRPHAQSHCLSLFGVDFLKPSFSPPLLSLKRWP